MTEQQRKVTGQNFYEEWMDFKTKVSRPPSTLSKESIPRTQKTNFYLSQDYANGDQESAKNKNKSNKEAMNNSKERASESSIIGKIKSEFRPYYKWVSNGKTDDMSPERIKKILFPNK